MIELFKEVITEKGIYIVLAVIGMLSGISTMFLDMESTVTIKWLLFIVTISLIIIIIFFSFLNKIVWEKQIIPTLKIIKFYKEKETIILKTNQNISVNSLLTIYINDEGYEYLQYLCFVENIQEDKLISLKIVYSFRDDKDIEIIKNGIVKTTIPQNILGELNG